MTCARCGAPAALDQAFARLMLDYGLPQRRWACPVGHSVTTDVPSLTPPPLEGHHKGPRVAPTFTLTCACGCGRTFTSKSRHKRWASDACRKRAFQASLTESVECASCHRAFEPTRWHRLMCAPCAGKLGGRPPRFGSMALRRT